MERQTAQPTGTLQSLASLRQRVRRVFVADGVATLAFGVCGAMAGSFVLDYFLLLPVGMRVLFLVAGLSVLVYQSRKRVGAWLTRRISDEDLANLVERSQPELAQSLITAVELTRPGNEAAAYVSTSLLDSVVRSVENRIAQIRFDGVVAMGRLYSKVALVGGALAVLAGTAVLQPELSRIWLKRNLLLGAEEWPKTTELELLSPSLPVVVAVGDSLEVAVRALRGHPQAVRVLSAEPGHPERAEVLAETTSGVYRKVFGRVAQPFDFRISGGDDEIGPFRVEVRLRPRIDMQSIRLWCEYPATTGLPPTPVDEPFQHGNLKVPTGTRVRYRMSANVPIRRAYFVYRDAEGGEADADSRDVGARREGGADRDEGAPDEQEAGAEQGKPDAGEEWPDPGALELEITEDRSFGGEFVVEQSGHYYYQIESLDSFRSSRPDRFRVEALPDRAPLVKILVPERVSEKVSPEASVKIRVAANDDYGVRQGAVHGLYFETPGGEGQIRSYELPLEKSPGSVESPRLEIEEEILLRVAELPSPAGEGPPAGASFQFKALVTDHGGNTGESRMHFLEIVDKADLLRDLGDRLMVVRDQLREARQRQESARRDLTELATELLPKGEISAEDARKLFRHQQNQRSITRAVERGAEDMERILDRSVLNKVGDDKWRNWVAGVTGDLKRLAAGESKEAEDTLGALRKEALDSPQELDRMSFVTGMQRKVERELDHLILRLTEFGDMNALIQMLREVRRRQTDLREDTRSRVPGALSEEAEK